MYLMGQEETDLLELSTTLEVFNSFKEHRHQEFFRCPGHNEILNVSNLLLIYKLI